jgi:hypothetical protein
MWTEMPIPANAFLQGGTTTLGGERNINIKNIKLIEEEGFVVNQGFLSLILFR